MNAIIEMLNLSPAHILALVVGTLVSLGTTQVAKKHFLINDWVVRTIAFVVGSFSTYTMYPPMGLEFAWPPFWAAFIVGCWTPTGFAIFKKIAKKRNWAWADSL